MSKSHKKEASALVYLVEELGDARLLCDQLQRYVDKAVKLVENSEQKDHFFEVAGDLLQGIPETTQKLHKALQAVALATNRLDYEDVKQELSPEKVDELETVLDDVRIHPVRRRGSTMTPEEAIQQLRSLVAQTEETGGVPITAALQLIESLEAGSKTASAPGKEIENLITALSNPPEGVEPSRVRLAAVLRHIVAGALSEDALLAHRVAHRAQYSKEAKGGIDIRELNNLKKSLEDILVEAKKGKNRDIETMAQRALKTMKMASTEEEEGTDKTANDKLLRSMDKVVRTIENNLKTLKASMGKYKSNPEKYAPQLDNFADDTRDIASAIRAFGRSFGKTASEDEGKESKFEEGKPADPTKNMSPEDAKEWKENVDHDGSNLKKAGRLPSPSDLTKKMKASVSSILKTRVIVRELGDMLNAVEDDATGAGIFYSGGIEKVTSLRKKLRSLDSELGVYDFIEAQMKAVKSLSKTAASGEEKESRYEEGESVDPTKEMSPEDAKKWKENTDKYDDKFKKEAAVDPSTLRSLVILAEDHKGSVKDQPRRFEAFFKSEDQAEAFVRDAVMEYPPLRGAFKVTEGASNRWWVIAEKSRMERLASDSDGALAWKVEAKYNTVNDFQVGDIVRYTGKHLRQTGQQRGAPINGKVKDLSGSFVKVQWSDRREDTLVSPAAIEHDPRYKKKASGGRVGASPFDKIRPGTEVTVADRRGKKQTGKATQKTPAGWMVNVNGKEVMATPDNVVNVKTATDWKAAGFGGVGTWFKTTPPSDGYTDYYYAFDKFTNGALKGMRVGVGSTGRTLNPKFESLRGINLPIVPERDVPKKVQDRAFAAVREYRAKEEQAAAKAEEDKQQMSNVSPPATPTREEIMTLLIMMGTKPSYRGREMSYRGLGDYGVGNIHIASLLKRGILTLRGKSIMIDKSKAKSLLSKAKPTIMNDEKMRLVAPYGLLDKL